MGRKSQIPSFFLSLPVVVLASIPAAAPLMGLKIPLFTYLTLMIALGIVLFILQSLWRERLRREKKDIEQSSIALSIVLVCIIGMQSVFWLYTPPANQQTINLDVWPARLTILALIFLILSMWSQIPHEYINLQEEEEKRKESKEDDKDINLALYTFYEGRVQTTKSILVGILVGILSLQIPIYLGPITNQEKRSFLMDPIVILFIISLPMFSSMKLHMGENNDKSKMFLNLLPKCVKFYNPPLKNWRYKARRNFPLELEWVFLGVISYLAILSIIFHKYR